MSKKQKRKRSAETSSLTPEEREALLSILKDPFSIGAHELKDRVGTSRVAQALLESLPLDRSESATLVLALKEAFPEKTVQKEAKRAEFRLRQNGVTIPEETAASPHSFRLVAPEPAPEPSAYLGPLDGLGARAVFVMIPQALSGAAVGMGVISDEKGFLDFLHARYGRKRLRELKEIFFARVPHMTETSLAHAFTVMEATYGKAGTGAERATREYLRLRPLLLGNVSLLQRAAVLDFISPEEVAGEGGPAQMQVEGLLSHEWMKSWIIDPETISPLLGEVVKAEESPILVSPEQKASRIEDLKRLHLDRIYPPEKRTLLKGRLEEMAYLFHKQGEEQHARTALGAAFSLEERDSAFRLNPFLHLMVDRSLAYYFKPLQKEGRPRSSPPEGGGLILP